MGQFVIYVDPLKPRAGDRTSGGFEAQWMPKLAESITNSPAIKMAV